MADVVFAVDVKGWAKAFKSEKGTLGAWMTDLARDVRGTTRFEAPGPGKFPRNRTGINYGKGTLMNQIEAKVYAGGIDEIEAHVYVKPKYARFVLHGTRPHVILPRKPGGVLKFYWFRKGKHMVVRKVNHPGTAANDFMGRGLKRGFRAAGLI